MDTQHEDGVRCYGEEGQGVDGEDERLLEALRGCGQLFLDEGLPDHLDEEAGEEVEGHEEDGPEDHGQVDRHVLDMPHGERFVAD